MLVKSIENSVLVQDETKIELHKILKEDNTYKFEIAIRQGNELIEKDITDLIINFLK